MLKEVLERKESLDLSTRQFAKQLNVSPSLLSETLTGKRALSRPLSKKLKRWLNSAIALGGPHHPNTVYRRFMAERASFVSIETMRYYKEKLEPFVLWCEKQGNSDITLVERAIISEFLTFIRKGRRGHPLSNGAIKLHHQTLKTLFNYVGETCGTSSAWTNPVCQIKVKSGDAQRTAFSNDEINHIFQVVDRQSDKVLRLRNRAIITVLLNSALRASELLSMKVGDYASDGRMNVVGKGGKHRTVTIGKSGVDAVHAYLKVRRSKDKRLWLTRSGSPLTKAGLRQVMCGIRRKSSSIADGVYAHRFRHTAVTRLLKTGVPLRSVQLYAGHSDPQTTLRYAQAIGVDEAIAAVDAVVEY